MKDFLEFVEKKGGKLTKSNSENPKLVIVGEDHHLNTVLEPKIFFNELKPKYFFCENVEAGKELDYQRCSVLIGQITKEKDIPNYGGNSFEDLMYMALHHFHIFGAGYTGVAMTEWFPESPETIFVGMDLPGSPKREDEMFKNGTELVEKLREYLADMLHSHGDKLGVKEYGDYGGLRDWMRDERAKAFNAYEMVDFLGKITERTPKIFSKAKLQDKFGRIMKDISIFDMEREKTMGNTMAGYTAKSENSDLGIVGSYHITPSSFIFPILERKSIPYVAIDVTKK